MSLNESGGITSIEIDRMVYSSIDVPGKMALVILTAGCMLRCPYCHNVDIIEGGDVYDIKEVFRKIDETFDFIDSVMISGGEPLMQDMEVLEIFKYAKSHGLKTKLDTNGFYPKKLEKIIKLVDYVALDIKAPFDKYEQIIGANIGSQVRESMEICIKDPDTFLECRTTYVPALMDPEDIIEIAKSIQCNMYTLQQFINKTVLDESLLEAVMPLRDDVKKIAESLKPFQDNIKIKTYEFGEELIS
jgi:pyruvate formate lyase activating enzyme